MNRFYQVLLIVSSVGFCWLAMMVLHELGHVLNAWLGGGSVMRVYLHPLAFSRTDLAVNPHPLLVAWGGAIWGCLLPLVIWALVWLLCRPQSYLAAFFAGFCLIANGAYLAGGSFFAHGSGDDAGVIMANGGLQWQLIAFGVPAIAAGLYVWGGLGPKFGLGPARGEVDRRGAVAMTALLLLLVAAELVLAR